MYNDPENSETLCKNVFRCNDTQKDLCNAITQKWAELINYLEALQCTPITEYMQGDDRNE